MPDRDFIARGLMSADLDAVRVTLFQHTGDTWLAALPAAAMMTDEQRVELRARATDWLVSNASSEPASEPALDELRVLMDLATGAPMGDLEFAARRDLPGFREFPFFAQWDGDRPAIPDDFIVAIIGSGFAGIGMAVQLDLLGIPYVVLERRPEAGGVWSINTYPDVRVDTMSVTYEFQFEKPFPWQEYFGRGPDVRRYLNDVSTRRGVRAHTRFEHDVVEARFDPAASHWHLTVATPTGEQRMIVNAVISCGGLFATPNELDVPGRDDFAGDIVHTARWPEGLSLAGRNVAVIGNGSTGVQILGALAREAAHVDVYQRTPQWIMPRANYGKALETEHAWLIDNFPGYRNWWRFTSTAPLFDTHALMVPDPDWQAAGGKVNCASDAMREQLTGYIEQQTGARPDLVERLVPDYAPLSRRPVVDNGWYAALTRDNVALVDTPIEQLVGEGIRTADGAVRPCDLIVTATGYKVARYLWPTRYIGAEGQDLHAEWDAGDGPRAYIGLMHAGFPNLFTLYGPNSQPISGGPAQPVWFAVWSAYVARVLMRMLRERAAQVDVTRAAYDAYNVALDAAAGTLVQMTKEGGVDRNYYVNADNGRLQVNAPWYSPEYHRLCSEVAWDDLVLSGTGRPQETMA